MKEVNWSDVSISYGTPMIANKPPEAGKMQGRTPCKIQRVQDPANAVISDF